MSSDTRLIERWLPIAELGEESVRERRSMTALPPTYYLHVWWARRPLVASRAAVLASLLPENADRDTFLHVLGIHGDPVRAKKLIDRAVRSGVRVKDPYGYPRAFAYRPTEDEQLWITKTVRHGNSSVLDPTAGGGTIPFEAARLGVSVQCNDLNPVASLLLYATVKWPMEFGAELLTEYRSISQQWRRLVGERLKDVFPPPSSTDEYDITFLWARTVICPYCDGLVPLSPNWRLTSSGVGVRLVPHTRGGPGHSGRHCTFEIVDNTKDQSTGTVTDGSATCPYDDCRPKRIIESEEIKQQAQSGGMGEQLYTVIFKRRVKNETKAGGKKDKWVRGFRAPNEADANLEVVTRMLASKLPEWEALDMVPSEKFPEDANDDRPIQYGMPLWRDLFSVRQLLCHGTAVEVFRELLDAARANGKISPVKNAAFVYLALALDKMADYNSRMTRWHVGREVMVNTFDRHDFSFKWSYAEMALLIPDLGYDWAVEQIGKCLRELVELSRGEKLDRHATSNSSFSFTAQGKSL